MDKKALFIEAVDEFMDKNDFNTFISALEPESQEAITSFWEAFKTGKSVGGFTENGQKILQYMQENADTQSNMFKAKEIGEGLFMSSRSVSGAMRKLITDGYVNKLGGNPVVYAITDAGREASF